MQESNKAEGVRSRLRAKVLSVVALSTLGGAGVADAALVQQISRVESTEPLISLVPGFSGISNSAVKSGDTFDITIVGFNANNSGAFLTAAVDPVFGTTQVFPADGLGGQALTVTSSEVIGATTTTDTFSISVPTNFDPAGTTVGGKPVVVMFADIGGFNAGPDTIDFASNVSSATVTGDLIYSGGTFVLNPTPNNTFTNGGTSLATAEGVNAGGSDLAGLAIHQFDFSVTYANPVPEPASMGLFLTAAGAALLRRRRPQ
jgi:hypothetical protein